MSERHTMGPVEVARPMRPESWDAYIFQAASSCTRCGNYATMELWLPGR